MYLEMHDRCAQCLTKVPDDPGSVTPHGETLCGACHFALWGPRGTAALSRASETRRPDSRGPQRDRPVWIPGATGELTLPSRSGAEAGCAGALLADLDSAHADKARA
jgi:hypothetical protein